MVEKNSNLLKIINEISDKNIKRGWTRKPVPKSPGFDEIIIGKGAEKSEHAPQEVIPGPSVIKIPLSKEDFECLCKEIKIVNGSTRFPSSELVTIDTEKEPPVGFYDFLDAIVNSTSNVISDEGFHELRDSRYLKFWPISSLDRKYLNISNN